MELQFACPHCGDAKADDWELLDANRVQTIRCNRCGEHFHLAVMECLPCAHETVFRWGIRPAGSTLAGLRCEGCGRPFASNSHADEGIRAQTLA